MSRRNPILDAARAAGEEFYFTGIPCRNGHIAKRRTKDRGCTACRSAIDKRSYCKHRDKRIAKSKRWNENHPDEYAARQKKYIEEGRAAAATRKWAAKNRDAINAYRRALTESDMSFRLRINLANRIGQAVRYVWGHKSARTLDLIGCTIEELRAHLERQFQPGMSWENYGYGDDRWHIDHVRPCATFDLTDPAQQRMCFHYSNLQPLWQPDNFRKNKRIEEARINA